MFKRLYYIIAQRLYVLNRKTKPSQGKVYMFHKVADDGDVYAIRKENFVKVIDQLFKNRNIVDIETLLREKDPRNVVISFDDVYESVYFNAYPLLKEKDVPYYLFICDEFLNKDGYLSSKMVLEMLKDSKAIIGSHLDRHVMARFIERTDLEKGLSSSKKKLEEEFGVKVDCFAFPFGSMYACSKEDIEMAKGYYDHIFMTYDLPYHEDYGNIIPRMNMNDSVFEGKIK